MGDAGKEMTAVPASEAPIRPRVFLSYGRKDDEAFVARLHERLTAAGVHAWFDRVDMPNRGLTFCRRFATAASTGASGVGFRGLICVRAGDERHRDQPARPRRAHARSRGAGDGSRARRRSRITTYR